jgi:hypothetical protein
MDWNFRVSNEQIMKHVTFKSLQVMQTNISIHKQNLIKKINFSEVQNIPGCLMNGFH